MTAIQRNIRNVFTPKGRYGDTEKASIGPMSTGPFTPTISNGGTKNINFKNASPSRKSQNYRSSRMYSKAGSKLNYTTVFDMMRHTTQNNNSVAETFHGAGGHNKSKSIKSSDIMQQHYLSSSMPVTRRGRNVTRDGSYTGGASRKGSCNTGNIDIMG